MLARIRVGRRNAHTTKELIAMIEAHHLTKRYGDKTAVEDRFTARPGVVTGFLGPNGSVDHDAHDPRARRTDLGVGDGERAPLR